jgi:DNA-directed RNA polymerase specialized sigma24 family protein
MLRYAYGCTSREVGEQMGYGAGSVRKMTQRCLDRLTRDLHDSGFAIDSTGTAGGEA